MFTFDAGKILRAITSLRDLEAAIDHFQYNESVKKTDPIARAAAKNYRRHLDNLRDAVSGLDLRTSALAVAEVRDYLNAHKIKISYKSFGEQIINIAITVRRELSLIKSFCIEPSKQSYFEIQFSTFGPKFETDFPSAIFEIDEAGKCYVLSRSTACVFHLMRAMEIGIKSVARSLNISDPVKGAERNWGAILRTVKNEIDHRNGTKPSQWKPNDKDFFEGVYASLDAVRIAWRNTTMHVENKYTEDEAEHIFVTVRGFMKKLASRMDEQGQPLA